MADRRAHARRRYCDHVDPCGIRERKRRIRTDCTTIPVQIPREPARRRHDVLLDGHSRMVFFCYRCDRDDNESAVPRGGNALPRETGEKRGGVSTPEDDALFRDETKKVVSMHYDQFRGPLIQRARPIFIVCPESDLH